MAEHEKKKAQEEEGGGESAPLWIISFADMISLLMAFFVMLSTFNTFDNKEKEKLDAAIESTMVSCGGVFKETQSNSTDQSIENREESDGSTKPTYERSPKSKAIKQTSSKDFNKYKVFLIPSGTVFFSAGSAITPVGRQWLDTLAEYLPRLPGEVVISEQGPEQSHEQSINRTLSIVEYLLSKGIPSGRVNISSRGTLPQRYFQQQPMLEICLVEENFKK